MQWAGLPFLGVYSEEKVQETMAAMKARRDNLVKVVINEIVVVMVIIIVILIEILFQI